MRTEVIRVSFNRIRIKEISTMSIKVHLHSTHRQFSGGQAVIEVEGRTIGECMQDLVARHTGLKKVLFDEKRALQRNLEIYLNMESAYPDELLKPVKDGDHVHITVMLAGG